MSYYLTVFLLVINYPTNHHKLYITKFICKNNMIQNICCTFVSEIEKSYPQKPVAE